MGNAARNELNVRLNKILSALRRFAKFMNRFNFVSNKEGSLALMLIIDFSEILEASL